MKKKTYVINPIFKGEDNVFALPLRTINTFPKIPESAKAIVIRTSVKNNWLKDSLVKFNDESIEFLSPTQLIESAHLFMTRADYFNRTLIGIDIKEKDDIRAQAIPIEIEIYPLQSEVYIIDKGVPYKGVIEDALYISHESSINIPYQIKFKRYRNAKFTKVLKNEDEIYVSEEDLFSELRKRLNN